MYFKKLELVGFKSFSDKTVLQFEPGITAVVGPNGCGKSNIFDSIRWVLGEQSAKSLRGSEMQDVIFNGTDTKEPLGMAEVSLTFDNKSRFFNFDNDEVMITRRLFRSGESEYLLNKNQVRLKDILDLLLGTGIGSESYSIIAQGKIDLVLSSRPEDRRQVFDEASGITKYKAQKRETTRRLEETDQNLLRVNDIVTEVKRQISSLERQANKARRYKEVFEELKGKEISNAVIQKNEFLKQKEAIISELGTLQLKEEELLNAIRQQEARIASRTQELKVLEDSMMSVKNELMSLENQVVRNKEKISFNKENIVEVIANKAYLTEQISLSEVKLIAEEEKLRKLKDEYAGLKNLIEGKEATLKENELHHEELALSIRNSLDNISKLKKDILDIVGRIAAARNQISEFNSQQQVYFARKKRLEIDKAKAFEEKVITEEALNKITLEVLDVKRMVEGVSGRLEETKISLDNQITSLNEISIKIVELDNQKSGLQSHKEFLEKLKTKYEDIGESLNAVVYLDHLPSEKTSGLVIKIKDSSSLSDEDRAYLQPSSFKLSGEAKPIDLDTTKIDEKISNLQSELDILKNKKIDNELSVKELNRSITNFAEELHTHQINLANKETSQATILEQFNKIKEEEDIIVLELADVVKELSVLESNIASTQDSLSQLNKEQIVAEDSILKEEDLITSNSKAKEEVLVSITQSKTEIEALNRRIVSDEATLRILEETYSQDKSNLDNIKQQVEDSQQKIMNMEQENSESEAQIIEFNKNIEVKTDSLKEADKRYREVFDSSGDVSSKIDSDRQALDNIKNKLYELQMQEKDIDYKFTSMKDRMLQAYKLELDTVQESLEVLDRQVLLNDIESLKAKLDSYGTVNLVAIEEYDELKKRYDFLIQQQTDLNNAKESLHQAILKINRTTKQMFMETFEKVREEFRSYFRLLFNGGDAQVYLMDEQDPLESGIEIICRPPGKKLQNVLLLSGGEKSMSAIALIFAIFKVKPSPFCILDEIDAALDEANVDRFSRALQEFAQGSQFIVITHNKKTIINAGVMYGITMQQSGVSKIVSVKFANDKDKNKEPEAAVV